MGDMQVPVPVVSAHTESWRTLIFPAASITALLLSFVLLVALVFTHSADIKKLTRTQHQIQAQQANIKAVSIAAALQAAKVSCDSSNEVRAADVSVINILAANARRAAIATGASPTATAEQKAVAFRNLTATIAAVHAADLLLAPKNCTDPLPLVVNPKP